MARTATKEKSETKKSEAPPPEPKAQLPVEHQMHAPRLPYYSAIKERFGVDRAGWNALVNSVYPHAKSVDAVMMVLSYCKSRKLDPFKRVVHLVPMWDSKLRHYVDTVWPGIAEVRTTAFRTGQYAGCDEAEFGPDRTETFEGMVGRDDNREKKTITVTFPEWCRITVYRFVNNHRVPFVGPKVYWLETYAKIGGSKLPNDMWADKRTRGQLEKCAEAAALRKAFPEELGGEYVAEEMEGRTITDEAPDKVVEHQPVHHPEATNGNGKAATSSRLDAFGSADDEVEDAEVIGEEQPAPKAGAGRGEPADETGLFYGEDKSKEQLDNLLEDLSGPHDAASLAELAEMWSTLVPLFIPAHQKQAADALEARAVEIMGKPANRPSFKKAK